MPRQPELSATEWMAVSVALNDAADCGCGIPAEPGSLKARIGTMVRAVFGGEPRTGLADPRLETLRRFVCTTRQRRQVDDGYAAQLSELGFNRAQIDALALLSA